ncbi:hypothetical protein [Bradyrhizobium betae]|uniref:Uncharacterized protein n=1 Tax=Bradyrhizobium betae TaxID=244734 RepID=A0A5P6P175_9BRAD|nr:hypothetical protein [Bradyrhizobium betae]MCS3727925.1 Asp-tRNA(Asn)/Glu-tRNA(Gln) amidotransferase B subunit [Bradyrhizobium betae]QFI72072.1 hypothetical protein F8237_06540 [Bradyrhizobium betae]
MDIEHELLRQLESRAQTLHLVLHRGHRASVDLVQNVLETRVSNHHMQSCPALERPVLLGWFVGQMMKVLNSNADTDEMLRKAVAEAGQKKT